jgi:amino-acid N-acetyltransferase
MACLTVNPEVQARATASASSSTWRTARAPWAAKLFVLTTRTAHWFLKRGFVPATVDACRRTASACTTGSANPRF